MTKIKKHLAMGSIPLIFTALLLLLCCLKPFLCAAANPAEPAPHISIITETGRIIVFQLNNSPAAQSLYNQLPLTVPTQNYAANEKIFYPPQKLNTANTPPAQGPAGTLAYYAPWANIALFYGECSGASGLYALGQAISGTEYIADITGKIKIQKAP